MYKWLLATLAFILIALALVFVGPAKPPAAPTPQAQAPKTPSANNNEQSQKRAPAAAVVEHVPAKTSLETPITEAAILERLLALEEALAPQQQKLHTLIKDYDQQLNDPEAKARLSKALQDPQYRQALLEKFKLEQGLQQAPPQ